MSPVYAAPMLLIILVGLVCGISAWAVMRGYEQRGGRSPLDAFDRLLLALGFLAAFALGLFVAYTFLSVGGA